MTPGVRGNAGCYRPFTVKAPEGSILNCTYPASVSVRVRTGWYLAPNIFKALSGAAPSQVQSYTGLPVALGIYGRDAQGATYSDMLFSGGGQGASAGADGKSALMYPTSAANTPIEMVESRVPIVVTEKSFIADSGGPGTHRGGLAQRVRFRKRDADGMPMQVSIYPEGARLSPDGLFGGRPGLPAHGLILDANGNTILDVGSGDLVTLNDTDSCVELVLAGGSGFGDPSKRAAADVAHDVAMGWVTSDAATRDYGNT